MKRLVLMVLFGALAIAAAEEKLPVPGENGAELTFADLLKGPVGERGLRLSDKAKALNGKRVRILGHMVYQENPVAGRFLLAPVPVQLHDEHYGLADDLPATTVFVSMPLESKGVIQYKPGLLLVTGVLSVGNHEEPDGRISLFRIEMDAPREKQRNRSLQSTMTDQTRAGARNSN